jgi:cytochrome P450
MANIPNIFDLTPMNPEFNDNPHALLDRLRSECPVHRDTQAGTFIVSKYADVRGLLSDTTLWRDPEKAEDAAVLQKALVNQRTEGQKLAQMEPEEDGNSILFMDDPDHARVRKPLAQALYKRVAKSRPLVQQIVDQHLDAMAGKSPVDVMAEFCVIVPIDVIARILGVERGKLKEFRAWSEGVILSLNPFRSEKETERLMWAADAMNRYFDEMMQRRRKAPEDDLVSDMVQLQAAGAPLTDRELSINLQSLLVGGNLTTTDLIGNGIYLLIKNPGELAKLKADPSLVNSMVEEVLRYESPIDISSRIASRDMEVRGCPVHKTQSMVTSLRGANRDPEVFKDPHTFDIARKDAPHVAFGGGAHLCIGAPLARLEAQVAIPSFFARFPNARFADPDWKPEWRNLPFFRGLKELVVSVA